MQNGLSIRIAQEKDLPVVENLARLIWPGTYGEILSHPQMDYMLELFYSQSALTKQLVEQQHSFLLIEESGKVLGFASFSSTLTPHVFKIHKLYILPGQQGKGLGKLTVDFIIQQIRPKAAKSLELNVNRFNKARSFYEKLGFSIIREEDINIGEGYFMNDYVMSYTI